jgi:carboxyl-terminal processing protease
MRRPLLRLSGILLTLLLAGGSRLEAQSRDVPSYEQLQALTNVLNHLRLNYIEPVDYADLVRAAIDGMLRSLDPHSYLLARGDYERRRALERGELASTGLHLEMVDGRPTVLTVAEGSPADRARVQPGDRILSIDEITVTGIDAERLALKLAGERGSRVRLRFARGPVIEPDTFRVSLRREIRPEPAVAASGMVDATTGYLRLSSFTLATGDEVERTLRDLRARGMRRLVLDLRGNPGGLINAAVDVAGLFLPRGTLVFQTRGRRSDADNDHTTRRDGAWRDLPLVLLLDGRSASAAEALAGSLQDHDRALIVGRRSFGKALVQRPFVLQSGDVVFLTVGRVLTPRGRFIQRPYVGVEREQYYAAGGTDPSRDTLATVTSVGGRILRAGGGIAPDLEVPGPPLVPGWWSVASDSAFDTAISDSVAQLLPATPSARAQWAADTIGWRQVLLPPLLSRTRAALGVAAVPTPDQELYIAQLMATRVALVRWGHEGGVAFSFQNDRDLQAALRAFPDLPRLLAPVGP